MPVSTAFGTGSGVEGYIPPEPPSPDTMMEDIHRIAEKYDIPPTVQPRIFNLSAGYMAQKLDFQQMKVNAIIVTVITGLVYVFIGDYSSGNLVLPQTPHIVVSATVSPQSVQIALPMGEKYYITVQEGANATATGCLTALGL